jgi:hypothetical protein
VLFVVLSMSISSSCPKGATKFPTPPWNHGRRPEAVTFSVLERERAPEDPVTCPQHLFPVEQAPGRRAPPSPALRSERDACATVARQSMAVGAVSGGGRGGPDAHLTLALIPHRCWRCGLSAEGEGFEPPRDLTAPCDFRDSFHFAQPCALTLGARHNARQFATRGLERTDRTRTTWASSRLLRLKIESQLREAAPSSRLSGRCQPPSGRHNAETRESIAPNESDAQALRTPGATLLVAAGDRADDSWRRAHFGTSRAPSLAARQRWQVSSPGGHVGIEPAAGRVCANNRTPPQRRG